VFSAEGMLTCDITHTAEASRQLSTPFTPEDLAQITTRFETLEQRVMAQFAREGANPDEVTLARSLGVRFRQQVHTVEVDVDPGPVGIEDGEHILERFITRYGQVYGKGARLMGGGNEVELHRVVGTRPIEPVTFPEHADAGPDASGALKGQREAYFETLGFITTSVYVGDALQAGNRLEGPAIIERMGDSVVVPPSYAAELDRYLTIRLSSLATSSGSKAGAGGSRTAAA
jgi:N-methylhydantoinase A